MRQVSIKCLVRLIFRGALEKTPTFNAEVSRGAVDNLLRGNRGLGEVRGEIEEGGVPTKLSPTGDRGYSDGIGEIMPPSMIRGGGGGRGWW